jgi:hypothetical protein
MWLFVIQTGMWQGRGLGATRMGMWRLGRMGMKIRGGRELEISEKMRLYWKMYKMLHEEERKGKHSWGIESPYIHNSFFLPRD